MLDAENNENAQFCTFLFFLTYSQQFLFENDRNNQYCNHFHDDFPMFDVLCKSFLYKKNHQKYFNIFRVGPKIRVGRDT